MTEILTPNSTIVFDGDSLTNRRTPPSLDTWPLLQLFNWDRTWADELSKLLFCWHPELNLSFHNAAVGGSNSRDITAKMDAFVLPHAPSLVLMTIGTNDHVQGIAPDDFRRTLTEYAQRLKAHCQGRMLFVGGFHHLNTDETALSGQRKFDEVLRAVARDNGGYFVDAGLGLKAKSDALLKQSDFHAVASDGSHMNAIGNLIIAGEVYKFLNE